MNKNFMILTGISLLLLVGIFLYSNSNSTSISETSNEMQVADNLDETQSTGNSKYISYSSGILDKVTEFRVLFFYANWCPTCRPADANFKANIDKFPDGLTVIRVNYNDSDTDEEEKSLAEKYDVTYQHTFVQIDKSGNAVNKWNGGSTNELLKNIIKI